MNGAGRVRPHLLLASLVAGLAAGPYLEFGHVGLIALVLPALASVIAHVERNVAAGVLCAAIAICGLIAGNARAQQLDRIAAPLKEAAEFAGRGFVTERFRRSGDGLRARVALNGRPAHGSRLELRLRLDRDPVASHSIANIAIGDEISIDGRLRPLADLAHRGDKSYFKWLRSEGVDAVVDAQSVLPTGARRRGVLGTFDLVRSRAERSLAAGLADQPAALMRGMVLGGDEQFAPALRDDFRAVGLSHIVAVSGANIMLLAVLVAAVCGAVGIGYRTRFWIATITVCVYVPLCGASASVVRAGVMGIAALCATRLARNVSRAYLLLLAALALLAINPRAPEDVGAQLSFAAVIGLMAFAAPLQRLITSRWHLPQWLAEAAAATAAATLATLPVSAFHFGQVSAIALLANVLAAPVIGPIVWLGSIEAFTGQFALWPAALFNAVTGFLLGYLIALAQFLAAVPGAQTSLRLGWWGLAGGCALLVLAAFCVGPRRHVVSNAFARLPAPRPLRVNRGLAAVALAAPLCWGVFVATIGPRGDMSRPAIVFLDVGQGDAVLLLGSNGCEALIDGGPYGSDVERRVRRLGIDRLELVMASHPAADHHGGLVDLVAAGQVRVERFLAGGLPTEDSSFLSLADAMRRQGAVVEEAAAGASWRCGDLALGVIAPDGVRAGQRPPDDPNTRAAVVEATVGSTTLLTTGDAESPQLAGLDLRPADVLKVPHHGSSDDGLTRILERVRPRVAVIQAGAGNPYGHPRADLLNTLSSVPVIKRTDRDGTVTIRASTRGPGTRQR